MKKSKNLKENQLFDNKLNWVQILWSTKNTQARYSHLIPICPGSLGYNFNKYKTNFLKAYVQDKNNNAKMSPSFPTEDDEIVVSFDIISLYMKIPIADTLNVIKD